jgi:hypothetical protein
MNISYTTVKRTFFIISFLLLATISRAQHQSSSTLNFFGVKCSLDSLEFYTALPGNKIAYTNRDNSHCSFVGKQHVNHEEVITEDSNNPGSYFFRTKDTLTTVYEFWIIDSVSFSQMRKDSLFTVVIGKKSYPVCEFHIVADSMAGTMGHALDIGAYPDFAFYNMYQRFIIPDAFFACCANSNNSTKIIVTDIYYYDWSKREKIKLNVTLLVKR